MGVMEKAIQKYCRVTNSKMTGYNNGWYCFINGWGEKMCYRQNDLLREVDNFE
ncbi:hypothetical protein P4571_08025 [Niallia alba]|uniref:hypothetical protein n=1 Tax=Niallia alba TaxID=2729105 RepID=UPI002E21EDEB|nr:hypothetical protein [Niallia alba]